MSATQARIGYQTSFAIEDAPGSGVFVTLEEVYSVTPPEIAIDTVEASHFASPDRFREFVPGMKDPGSASCEMNYVPNSATDQRLDALEASGDKVAMRITYPNAVTVTFTAQVANYSKAIPVDDRMTAVASFKVSSAPVMAAGVAPANTLIPAVVGIAQVGVTLTAYEGVWTNAPTSFAYQWQADTLGNGTFANITGATSRTYTPVADYVGDALRVQVTATNAAGSSAAVSSAPTPVALAA